MVRQLQRGNDIQVLLTPNRSFSWRGNVAILLSLSAFLLVIVIGMIWAGAWLVLPFAGLELLALTAALYYTARKCQRQEVLIITAETLRLEKGIYRKQAQWELPRKYTRVQLAMPRHPWTPPKLYLYHRDTEVPLAPFLNLADTHKLVETLERGGFLIERRLLANSEFD